MNILIVEDDVTLANNIKKTFEKRVITNRIKVLHDFASFSKELWIIQSYDIVLVDIILEGNDFKNGIDIVKLIRQKSQTIPVVVISWLHDINRLESTFKNGANDYIAKPFRLQELELRVFRWFSSYFQKNLSADEQKTYFWLTYDINKNEFYYQGETLHLTKQNKYLLGLFFHHPEKVLDDQYLIEKIYGDITSIIDRNLRVNILRLKEALKTYKLDSWIQNIRWEWYMFKKINNSQ